MKKVALAVVAALAGCATAAGKAPPARPAAAAASAPAPLPKPSAADEAAAKDAGERWGALIDHDKTRELPALCEPWLKSPNRLLVAEGHKCLANFELAGAGTTRIEGDKAGGVILSGYKGPGVEAALAHLDAGIAASPDDLSIHQGRLHVLEASGNAQRMSAALEQSLAVYRGPDALDAWLAYTGELEEARQLESGVAFLRVLLKRYPDHHEVVGNLGAFLQELGKRDEALPLLRRAVELAPDDAYDNWNLGDTLSQGPDKAGAETFMRRALAHASEKDRGEMSCKLGRFLEAERGNPAEACTLEKAGCEKGDHPACKARKKAR
jgi:tetratricopeptide (TPR) repeat protein